MINRLIAVSVLFGSSLSAQVANQTSLVGTVTDATGKSISGASVSALNTGTSETYPATTNEQGYYVIQFIRAGTYELTIQQSGFQTYKATNIQVETNQIVRNDAVLKIGELKQTVSVEASAQLIKTDDASVSDTISTRNVAELPLNGRDPLKLATITPGVIQGLKATNGVPPGQDFIGAGTREIQNSVSLDGISVVNNLITTTPTRPAVDAVQEVEVQTGTYSAQYGAYLGVHINVVTKSGTNSLHGSAVEFVRNDKFDAKPFFLTPTLANPQGKKNPLRQNQFGFELDGPIFVPKLYDGRNKSFFMVSYEGLRQIRASTSLNQVLTPKMWGGDFSETTTVVKDPANGNAPFPGNVIPTARLSPFALKLRPYYAAPTNSGITNNISGPIANNNNTDQSVDRLDQNIGDKVRLFFRWQQQSMNLLAGSLNPTSGSTSPVDSHNYSVGYTHTFTPSMVNDMRFGYQFFKTSTLNYFYVNGLNDAGSQLGIPGFDGDVRFANPGIPEFNINGFTGFGNSGTNWFQDDKTWQGFDQISWTRGAHTIMAGAEFRKLITGRAAVNSPRGVFNFTGQYTGYAPADFMLGIQANDTTAGPEIKGVVAAWRDGFFVLDKWQATRKLSVNIGLRYELPTVPYSVNGYATLLNRQQTQLIPTNPPQPGFRFIDPNHNNWAPRLGLAYRLTEKTIIRAGAGIYYNPNQTNSFTFLTTNPPFSPVVTYTGAATMPTLSLLNPVPSVSAAAPTIPNVITDSPYLPSATMNQWSLGVDREFWRGSAFQVQYLGSHSYHLDRSFYNNTPPPGPGPVASRRPNPLWGQIRTVQNDEVANYHGLSVVLKQRLSHGIQFMTHYTWAHSLDVSSDSNNGGAPKNPYNWAADYASSNWDIRHRLVSSFVYDIPFMKNANAFLRTTFGNWQFNGIVTAQSGMPFNVTYGTDTANTSGGGTNRPNVIGKASANCGRGHLVGCIDPSAFAIPALYTYGNAGRNLFRGPNLVNVDSSLFKNFPIKERLRLQFRAEFFNLLNHPNFSNPSSTFGTAAFGNITSTSTENRDIQFGLRLAF